MKAVVTARERDTAVRDVPRRRRQVRASQVLIVALGLVGISTPDLAHLAVGGALAIGIAVSRMRDRWALSDREAEPDA